MNVSELMTRGVECVTPQTTLQEAARKMRDLDVGPMPVCEGERAIGMLTDRDITIRATAEGLDPKVTTVDRVMTRDVAFCYENQDAREAIRLMRERQIRRLPVMDHQHKMVGIVSLGDLAVEMQDEREVADALEQISEPSEPRRAA